MARRYSIFLSAAQLCVSMDSAVSTDEHAEARQRVSKFKCNEYSCPFFYFKTAGVACFQKCDIFSRRGT
jgi:hypothetical protein